jgi:hypothetical protein
MHHFPRDISQLLTSTIYLKIQWYFWQQHSPVKTLLTQSQAVYCTSTTYYFVYRFVYRIEVVIMKKTMFYILY